MPKNKGVSILKFCIFISVFVFFPFFMPFAAIATEKDSIKTEAIQNSEHAANSEAHQKEKEGFNPGKMILDHVKDAHDWHILDYNGHPVSIPLLVILYDKGFHFFPSSKFEHGHAIVEENGRFYKLHEGKIYETTDSKGLIILNASGAISNRKPLDISITKNVLSLLISALLLVFIFFSIARSYNTRGKSAPKGIQSFIEPLIVFLRDDVIRPSVGKQADRFTPLLLTIFFFIFINNLMGLIPIFPFGANLTGNVAVPMILALIIFLVVNFSGNVHYWKHIFMPDVPKLMWILLIPIELFGVILKPFVLMLRLFANITAGHIIILGFFSLIFIFGEKNMAAGYGTSILSVSFTTFMSVLELLVAFLQAYVFTLLSALYIGAATEEHHHIEEHH